MSTDYIPTHKEQAGELAATIQMQVAPDLWRLVVRYGEATRAAAEEDAEAEFWLFLDALSAHFPAVAPAMQCLAMHIRESDYGRGAECGVVPPPPRHPRAGADE